MTIQTTITRTPPRTRHPALAGTKAGTWDPNGVGKVRGYPTSQAAFDVHKARLAANRDRANAAGLGTRKGVPNGFRGRRQEVEELRDGAALAGRVLASVVCPLTDAERLDLANGAAVPTTDDARAAFATAGLFAIALSPAETSAVRLAALKAVLPYLLPRPRGGHVVTLAGGLDWLNGLALAG